MTLRIASLLRYFPTYSETFVYRELAALREGGLWLQVITMRRRLGHPVKPPLAGPLLTIPRIPWNLPILPGALRQWWRKPAESRAAWAWGRRFLKVKDCLKALWLADRCHRDQIDLLHIHFAGEAAEVAELIRRAGGPPFSVTLHARDLFVPRASLTEVLEGARGILCISLFNKRFLEAHHPGVAHKAAVAHLGVPFPVPLAPPPPLEGPFPLLTVSRMVEKKGLATLLQALALLRDAGQPCRLTLLGDGPLRPSLEALISDLDLADWVRLEGLRPQAHLETLYAQGPGAFVLPCVVAQDGDMDGIPVALMEAMARGVPVISTPVSGIPELIQPDVSGLLVPPGDAQALAAAIHRLRTDPALRQALAQGGLAQIAARFRLEASAARVRLLLEAGPSREPTQTQ